MSVVQFNMPVDEVDQFISDAGYDVNALSIDPDLARFVVAVVVSQAGIAAVSADEEVFVNGSDRAVRQIRECGKDASEFAAYMLGLLLKDNRDVATRLGDIQVFEARIGRMQERLKS